MLVVAEDNEIQIKRLDFAPAASNAYIIVCRTTGKSLLVDAPAEANTIMAALEGTRPQYIFLTHNHRDHIGALAELRDKLKIPLIAHTLDTRNLTSVPEILADEGNILSVGNLKLEILHTPGHTPGSICLKTGGYLIAGDTIFPGGPGHTRTPADFKQIVKSISEKILVLSDDTLIYPGHGEATVLRKEKNEFDIFSSRPHSADLCGDVLWLAS